MRLYLLGVLAFSASVSLTAQSSASRRGDVAASVGERRTATAFEAARKAGPLALHAFLERMPKGADLHMHLSGAVYAETFLKDAAEDHLCINAARLALVKSVADDASLLSGRDRRGGNSVCRPKALRRSGGCLLHAELRPFRGRERA